MLVDLLHLGGLTALETVNERGARSRRAQHGQPLGVQHEIGVTAFVDALADFLLGFVEPVEFVEPDVVRSHTDLLADMPLAGEDGGVARLAEQFRQRDLIRPRVLGQLVAGEDGAGEPGAHRKPSGQDSRTGRRTGRLRIGRGELQSIASEAIDVWRRRPDRSATAIGAGVAPAHVVDDEPDDIGPPAQMAVKRVKLLLGRRLLVGMHQGGFGAFTGTDRF